MIVMVLSSLGIGLVCGWLTGMVVCRGNRPLRNSLVLCLANVVLGIWIFVLADWRAVPVFLGSMVTALLTHLRWQRELRNRFQT